MPILINVIGFALLLLFFCIFAFTGYCISQRNNNGYIALQDSRV